MGKAVIFTPAANDNNPPPEPDPQFSIVDAQGRVLLWMHDEELAQDVALAIMGDWSGVTLEVTSSTEQVKPG